MEYFAGPLVALAIALKYTHHQNKELDKRIQVTESRIELIEKKSDVSEAEMPKKIMATITPIALAVKKLNQQVGL